MSRNKREGKYAGKITGKHVRAIPKRRGIGYNKYREDIIWPDSLCALLVERGRGVEHKYDNSKIVGIAGEFSYEQE